MRSEKILKILQLLHQGIALNEEDSKTILDWAGEHPAQQQLLSEVRQGFLPLNDLRFFEEQESNIDIYYERFRQRYLTDTYRPAQTTKARPVRLLWRTAIAAAVVFMLAGVWYLAQRGLHQTGSDTTGAVIPPGHEGAVLTLANGSRLVLDSMHNGVVADENGTQLSLHNNQLVYNAGANNGEMIYNLLSTPAGRQFHVTLPDGTNVWLNAASSIRYPVAFTGNERQVEITGEAYLEVAVQAAKPFIVKTNQSTVQVLGTSFNIAEYEENAFATVSLLQGSIRVKAGSGEKMLQPGQQVQTAPLMKVAEANMEQVVAWKNGFFHFEDSRMETIAQELSRWYDIKVKITQPVPYKFNTRIARNTSLQEVLEILSLTNKVHFTMEGRTLNVLPGHP